MSKLKWRRTAPGFWTSDGGRWTIEPHTPGPPRWRGPRYRLVDGTAACGPSYHRTISLAKRHANEVQQQ